MIDKKYCCDKMKFDMELDRRVGPNIRVIKVEPENLRWSNPKFPYRFYITVGYEKGEKDVPRRMIDYCPYCKRNLNKIYRSDLFINEIDDSFMTIKSDEERSNATNS